MKKIVLCVFYLLLLPGFATAQCCDAEITDVVIAEAEEIIEAAPTYQTIQEVDQAQASIDLAMAALLAERRARLGGNPQPPSGGSTVLYQPADSYPRLDADTEEFLDEFWDAFEKLADAQAAVNAERERLS